MLRPLFIVLLFLFPVIGRAEGIVSEAEFSELMQEYCVRCHGDEKTEAAIDLSGDFTQLDLLKRHEIWDHVLDQLYSEEMPPKKPLPDAEEYEAMIAYIESHVANVDWTDFHDPGRMGLARLTTVEYRNSIRDIFGIDLQAGAFLGKDPEGNTGFTNDRDSLSFPLFAFDNFMREAERVTDAWLSFGKEPWQQTISAPDALAAGSDGSVELNDEGNAVKLKERNAPFQVNLDLPFSGLYELTFQARVGNQEPISAMHFMMNGKSIERFVIRGKSWKPYAAKLNLSEGANVISLGYDPDRAPLIQDLHEPRVVPMEIGRKVLKPNIPKYPFPDHLADDQQAKKAWQKLNSVIRAFTVTQRLADHLVKTNQVDYEIHNLAKNSARQVERFGPSKVPFNLAAGSVAVFEDIPQAQLEKKIREVTGFWHPEYRDSVNEYLAIWKKKYPGRVKKTPGRVEVSQVRIASHAIQKGEFDPSEKLREAATSPEKTRSLLQQLATRAFAREPDQAELDRLMRIYKEAKKETNSHAEALRDAVVAILVSPPFLLRYYEPDGENTGAISSHDFAERLSRFLWLSIPDQELRELAATNELQDPNVLTREVDRMIDSHGFESHGSHFR